MQTQTQPQETQYSMCKNAIEKNQFIPLTIGTKHYETLAMLQSDFGDDVTIPVQIKLCKYFAQGIPFQGIEDKKDRNIITKFLEKRIKILENNGQLAINTSFAGLAKRDAITKLKEIIKTLGEPDEAAKAASTSTKPNDTLIVTKKRNDFAGQLFTALYKVANLKNPDVQVDSRWDSLLEEIDNMTPDEALINSANIMRATKRKNTKSKPNSLEKYIAGISNTSTKAPKTEQTNISLVKLYTLFKTGAFLDPSGKADFASSLKGFNNNPYIIENMTLYYRTVIRFYRARYLEIIRVYTKDFFGKTATINEYPIESMIRIIYIMFSLSKYVFKDNEIFPEKQCLLRIKLDGPHTADIIKLLDRYSTFINDIESLDDDISGKSDLSKDSLKYQLIHLHDKTSLERRTKPIMQLICGKNINFDKDKMEDSVDKISKAGITEENKNQLKTNINDFFNKKNESLYIIYQNTPDRLGWEQDVKIKQLKDIRCFMANITDELGKGEEDLAPIAIDSKILSSLTKNNTFSIFGIYNDKPLELVKSITQMTGTILNAVYINIKLKAMLTASS
jgi:hypothetical protein